MLLADRELARKNKQAGAAMVPLLRHPSAHVQFAAAEALAHCGSARMIPALLDRLAGDADRFLEHAAGAQRFTARHRRLPSILVHASENPVRLAAGPAFLDERREDLLRFVEEQRFERLGVFQYSQEKGTAAEARTFEIGCFNDWGTLKVAMVGSTQDLAYPAWSPNIRYLTGDVAELLSNAKGDAVNLRVHLPDVSPEQIREQIAALGATVVPAVRAAISR